MSLNDIQIRDVRGIEHGTRCLHVAVGGALYRYLIETDEPVPGDPPTALDARFTCCALVTEDGLTPVESSWVELGDALDDATILCFVTDPEFTATDPCPTLSTICRDRGGTVYDHTGEEIPAP
jgi:hypothetical protein